MMSSRQKKRQTESEQREKFLRHVSASECELVSHGQKEEVFLVLQHATIYSTVS